MAVWLIYSSHMANINDEANAAIHRRLSLSNLTMRDLSNRTGISYTTLRRKLDGGSFTIDELSRVADALNVSPVSILGDIAKAAA